MSKTTTRWKDRGFEDKYQYAGWLYFNDLTDDTSKMYDDVWYDPFSGEIMTIKGNPDEDSDNDADNEEKD